MRRIIPNPSPPLVRVGNEDETDARDTAAKVVDALVGFENRWLGDSSDYFLAHAARLWLRGEVNGVLMDAVCDGISADGE